MTQALILAGGKGTRLAPRLHGRPKPLVEVDGVPLLERQLLALTSHGVTDVLVLVNHAADQIAAFVRQKRFDCRIRLIDDGEPRGTAGAVLACHDAMDERAVIVYGDTLFDIDVDHMLSRHVESEADATLLIHPNDHPADSDLVEVGGDGWITAFHPYPHASGSHYRNLVNAAFYIVERRALAPWRNAPGPLDFARDLFPAMLVGGALLMGYASFEYIKDLGTPERLDKAEKHLRSGLVARAARVVPQRAVFLDRDGTTNELRGHLRRREDLALIPGAGEAIRQLNDAELRTVLVTNQPVLARGDCTTDELQRIHDKLTSELGRFGAYLDAIYYCPHHPEAGFSGEIATLKRECQCRKPGTGMLQQATDDLNVDAGQSWLVGDSTADIAAAEAFGLTSVLVRTGEGGRDGKYPVEPDFVVDDLPAAAELITVTYPTLAQRLDTAINGIDPPALVRLQSASDKELAVAAGVLRRVLRLRGVRCVSALCIPDRAHGAGNEVKTSPKAQLSSGEMLLAVCREESATVSHADWPVVSIDVGACFAKERTAGGQSSLGTLCAGNLHSL